MLHNYHITIKSIGLGLVLFFFACGGDSNNANSNLGNEPANPNTPSAPAMVTTPDFNADSAYEFVVKQVSFGPRVPNSAGHILCGNWLIDKFKTYGAKVTVQEATLRLFDGSPVKARNIIAAYKPALANRIILSAHWDTRPIADQDDERTGDPIDGANDGGSGVAVLLELARLFHAQSPTIGVDIILWDAEDNGRPNIENSYCLGSQHWARNKHAANYQARYGINLDMVGAANATFLKEGVSMGMASGVVQKVWSTGQRLGYGQYFSNQRVGAIVDDHVYMNDPGAVKSIDIIDMKPEGGFFGAWHTHDDNIDVISRETLKAVGQTVAEVVYQEK
ncbi:MAG: M28 family peptidase [Bacteroidota bacterium]